MSNVEHYFENLLFHGRDCGGEPNRQSMTEAEQKAVEACADYVLYTLFCGRESFVAWATL